MSDHAWMELCEVSASTFEELQSSDTVCIQLGKSTKHPELTTLIIQAVPSPHLFDDRTVYLHPLLYEFLTKSSLLEDSGENDDLIDFPVSIAPLPFHEYGNMGAFLKRSGWTISRVGATVDLPNSSRISLTCVYHEPSGVTKPSLLEREMSIALEGRSIRANAMLALPTLSGVCLVAVSNIEGDEILPSTVYRVGSDVVLDVNFIDTSPVPENPTAWERDCPGYDDLLQQLITLSQLTGAAAPSGVLLTGCAGVGKSRLASCLAHEFQSHDNMHIHWVSAQDLLVRASWVTGSDLLELLLPATTTEAARCLLVLDDLHVLGNEDSEDPFHDPELLLVNNSILVALDRVSRRASSFVLGICHVASQLPKEFVRIGRLEKEIHMPPPTQVQRGEILASILHGAMKESKRHIWAQCLASQTAGCVASDLRRLCADAWTKAWSRSQDDIEITWNFLREAAQICIPSQLAQLDVTKTSPYPEEDGAPEILKVHEWSWCNFGGYSAVKKRLFRTVVMPWRRFISVSGDKNLEIQESWVTPPSGVLFHGPPGVGKTFAASCLASSLGLHVVKIRATDVLDQWLGGSEAAIRSLFARARSASPCVLFFDEIDAIASNREDDGASVDVTSRVLTTFLNEMDGITSGGNAVGGVLVVACTNRVGALDAALLRPGRLDEHVLLELPVISDVEEILQLHLLKVPLHENVSTRELSELFVELNASGADIERVCRDACLRAVRDKTRSSFDLMVTHDDLTAAIRDWRK